MLQSSQFDGFAFDPFSFQKDGLASAEVGLVTPVIVVLDEARDLGFEITGEI